MQSKDIMRANNAKPFGTPQPVPPKPIRPTNAGGAGLCHTKFAKEVAGLGATNAAAYPASALLKKEGSSSEAYWIHNRIPEATPIAKQSDAISSR